jgi:hypothetical protein
LNNLPVQGDLQTLTLEMGECVSYSKLCCPSDKTFLASEMTSPRNSVLRIEPPLLYLRKSISEAKPTTPDLQPDSPEIRSIKRRNTCIERKQGFLSKAREKQRKSSQFSAVSVNLSDFEANMLRSYTYEDEENSKTYQQRVSLESPLPNRGDYDLM